MGSCATARRHRLRHGQRLGRGAAARDTMSAAGGRKPQTPLQPSCDRHLRISHWRCVDCRLVTRVQRGRMGLQRILVALALAAGAVGVAGATRASATVTTLNGSYQYTHSDASLAVDGSGFQFRRTYNSPDIRLTQIGPGWTYNFNSRLDAVAAGSPDIYFIGEYGRSDYMVARADGTWLPRDPGVEDSLKRLPTGEYEVTTNSGQEPATWTFNSR